MKHGQELAHPPQLLPGLAHPPRLARAPALAHAPVSLMDCIKHEKETCAKACIQHESERNAQLAGDVGEYSSAGDNSISLRSSMAEFVGN